MSNRASPSTFLKNVMKNGIGRHVCQLQRVTLAFCKSHQGSLGSRDFIEDYLLDFTTANPGIVVYLHPRRHKKPYIQAEYLNGYSEKILVSKYNKDEIAAWLGQMRGRSGTQIMRYRKDMHTDTPSIQGIWHPFMFKDTEKSIVTDFRDKSLTAYENPYKSATDTVKEISENIDTFEVGNFSQSASDKERENYEDDNIQEQAAVH